MSKLMGLGRMSCSLGVSKDDGSVEGFREVSRLPVSYRLRPKDGGVGREDAKGASGWAYSAR